MSMEVKMVGEEPQLLTPVVKETTVALNRERAFALFTRRVGEWWPLATHSVEGERALGCVFEPRVGGRLYEIGPAGREHVWGTVLEWDPPARFVMTWHPGREESTAQQLEVSFAPTSEGGTLVRLVHSGWERLAGRGLQERANYDTGWDYVLTFLMEAAAR